jgi:hypothetical protein
LISEIERKQGDDYERLRKLWLIHFQFI